MVKLDAFYSINVFKSQNPFPRRNLKISAEKRESYETEMLWVEF